MKKHIYLAVLCSFIFSCTGMKVTTHMPFIKNESIKKVALVEVIIGKPVQAIFPLIDAGIFNGKMNEISDQILDAQKQKTEAYRETLAKMMKEKFGCEVVYGKELQSHPNFANAKTNLENRKGLETFNDNFPIALLADGEFNIFPFEKAKVREYFETNECRTCIQELCKALEVDAIVVSYSRVNVENVSSFGIIANSRLFSDLYILNKDGRKIGHGAAYSQVLSFNGKEINQFKMLLDEFNIIMDPLTTQITKAQN